MPRQAQVPWYPSQLTSVANGHVDFRCQRTRRKQYAPPRRGIKIHKMSWARHSSAVHVYFCPCLPPRLWRNHSGTAGDFILALHCLYITVTDQTSLNVVLETKRWWELSILMWASSLRNFNMGLLAPIGISR